MTERERLIQLLNNSPEEEYDFILHRDRENLADYLLDNGVIVPQVKAGDTIYRCVDNEICDWQIESIEIYAEATYYFDDSDNFFTERGIGKTVFLTKENAEKALKERENNG